MVVRRRVAYAPGARRVMVRLRLRWRLGVLVFLGVGCGGGDKGEVAPAGTDADGDGYVALSDGGEDCDDSDPDIHPGAEEICRDGIDQDCDGDPGDTMQSFFRDADGDGYGEPWDERFSDCVDPGAGWVTDGGDCLDEDPDVNPETGQRGRVFLRHGDGTYTEVTDEVAGEEGAPGTYELTEAGNLRFCAGTFYSHITVRGVGDPSSDTKAAIVDGFAANEAEISGEGLGRVLVIEDSAVQVRGLTLSGGAVSAADDPLALDGVGGAVLAHGESWIDLVDLVITDSSAGSGGCIGLLGDDTDFKMVGTSLSACSATDHGGGLYSEALSVNLHESSVEDSAAAVGGGVSIAGRGGIVIISATDLLANTAEEGGALAIEAEVNAEFNEGLLADNSATGAGGGMLLSKGRLQVHCEPQASGADAQGIVDNTASNGAGAYISGSADLLADGCDWDNTPDDVDTRDGDTYDLDGVGSWLCDTDGCTSE